jgi:hypothetical protein
MRVRIMMVSPIGATSFGDNPMQLILSRLGIYGLNPPEQRKPFQRGTGH